MIRPLRQCHRRMTFTLGICLPVTFCLGIALRQPAPTMNSLPAGLVVASPKSPVLDWESTNLFAKSPVTVRRFYAAANSNQISLEFSAPKDFAKPDLLVYWVPDQVKTTAPLPDNAGFAGRLQLPSIAATILPGGHQPGRTGALQSGEQRNFGSIQAVALQRNHPITI